MKKCNIMQALFAAVADVHVYTAHPLPLNALRKCNILRMYALAIRLFGRDPNDKAKPVASIGQWALLFQLASW